MEHWKPVIGFEDCYAVSDLGNVARTATYGSNPKKKWNPIASRLKKDGYVRAHLCKGGKASDPQVHRLVWEAFNGPIPEHLVIDHKNDNRSDNRLSNLAVVTRAQNTAYAYRRNGRLPVNNPNPGSKNGCAKLTEADILKIVRLYQQGQFQWQIGELFGVSQRAVSLILRGEKWGHVPRPLFRSTWGGYFPAKNSGEEPNPSVST